jgi:serine/threonine protein kinase
MGEIPDFTAQNYEIMAELGRNREGGRITWQAKELDTKKVVVIKQFCFATAGSNWSDLRSYEQEINILKQLNHPGIPKYLNSFTTEDGFCLIQEYKQALSLGKQRLFTPEDVKNIAIKILEILTYLQAKLPPILHRDIKPDNILVDQELNVYLVDFGLATLGSKKVSVSSIFKGTPGFIAPEQIIRPTLASDLYGLGVSLICLLTGIKSVEIQDLASEDDPYRLEFKELLPQLSLPFLNWLEKMISPQLKLRFKNAQEALESLLPLDLIRTPQPKLNKLSLDLYAGRFGETVRETITVTNKIPDTNLQGEWSVLPHNSDPPHSSDRHAWISFMPKKISRNHVKCQVFFDTSKLISGQVYRREIVFKTNGIPDSLYVKVKLHTAPLSITLRQPAYLSLGRFFFLLIPTVIAGLGAAAAALVSMAAHTMVGAVLGGVAVIWCVAVAWAGLMAVTLTIGGIGAGVGVVYLAVGMTVVAAVLGAGVIAGVEIGIYTGAIAGLGAACVINFLVQTFGDRGFPQGVTVGSLILTTAIALLLGSSLIIGLEPTILLALSLTITPLVLLLLYPNFQRARLKAKYKQAEKETLIKP